MWRETTTFALQEYEKMVENGIIIDGVVYEPVHEEGFEPDGVAEESALCGRCELECRNFACLNFLKKGHYTWFRKT